jgi:hypothetical protein
MKMQKRRLKAKVGDEAEESAKSKKPVARRNRDRKSHDKLTLNTCLGSSASRVAFSANYDSDSSDSVISDLNQMGNNLNHTEREDEEEAEQNKCFHNNPILSASIAGL